MRSEHAFDDDTLAADQRLLRDTAERALACMHRQGFEHAQAGAGLMRGDEFNIAHNEPSLLRSRLRQRLSLVGLVDGRRAATELTDLGDASLDQGVASLYAQALAAPQDAANAVSAGQTLTLLQGPQAGDIDLLMAKLRELLAFRAAETPRMMIEEGTAEHTLHRAHMVTTGGSELRTSVGCYGLTVFGTAREGLRTSSFNYAGGHTDDLSAQPAPAYFGIAEMLRDTAQQVDTQPLGARFVGDVVLTPPAVADLLEWLLGQVSDTHLIAGSSLYRARVGEWVASPLLTLRSRFDAPGVAAVSTDGFVVPPVTLLREGRLLTLTPSLYGSRKTGLPHVPVAPGGWEIAAGDTPRSALVAGVARGALVGRLSMGLPAANGDFSGVIKNSFALNDGLVGPALAESMITGNVARMLRDVQAVSQERLDTGSTCLPWLRVGRLHFS